MKVPDVMKQSFDSDRETLVGEIVLRAAAFDTARREAYLRQAAGGDPELLAEARRRLRDASDMPSSFLAGPVDLESLTLSGRPSAREARPPLCPSGDDRYQPEECLGTGGMAEVWRSVDRQLGRTVALKFLVHDDPFLLERFLREARSQARVQHDNVLDVYDTGVLSGRPYIAMRYVAGPTLMAIRESTNLEQKVRLLIRICEGLHAAHREGLIHRDVKPSNVLVEETPEGELKPYVGDFGIVTDPAQPGMKTTTGTLLGTPFYMAPERILDDHASIDRRSDVYSLGVTMYQLFSGVLPFYEEIAILVLRRILTEPARPLRHVVPSLPVEIEAIVMKCLKKDPDTRYPSMHALAADLRRFLDGEVVEAHAASLVHRTTKLVMRNKVLVAVAGAASALLVAAMTVAALLGVRAISARSEAELRRSEAEKVIGLYVDAFGEADPSATLDVSSDPSAEAVRYFAAVPIDELSDEQLSRYSTALRQIGEMRIRRGELEAAREPLERSRAMSDELDRRHPANRASLP